MEASRRVISSSSSSAYSSFLTMLRRIASLISTSKGKAKFGIVLKNRLRMLQFQYRNLNQSLIRKKLDPLEAYVPPVILAELQIQDLEGFLNEEKPEFEACRRQLPSSPASSLRVNIRAVAQYALDDGYSKTASDDVDRCLSASRQDSKATIKLMKSQLGTALTALESVLQTVPSSVLDKGKAMLEVYRSSSEEDPRSDDVLDSSEIQQLQSIL